MKNDAEMVGLGTNLRKKENFRVPEGITKDITCELCRKREKWFRAVEYFSCVDDVNF